MGCGRSDGHVSVQTISDAVGIKLDSGGLLFNLCVSVCERSLFFTDHEVHFTPF